MISAWHLLWIIPLSNLISMFAVGICGFGSKSESMSEAYKKVTYAATNEYPPALNILGEIALEKARLGQDSYSAAVAYFKSAVALGNPDSIYHIGCMIADGEGFAQNYQLAASYLSISAMQGMTDAQYRFAEMLDKGLGVKIDREEGCRYFIKRLTFMQWLILKSNLIQMIC